MKIDADTSHDWWAKRDDLDQVVNPKKRGAAARAQRAAREAFGPAGDTNVSSTTRQDGNPSPAGTTTSTRSSWDPSDVYSWGSNAAADPPPRSSQWPSDERGWHDETWEGNQGGAELYTPTPWDVLGLTSDATWPEVRRRHKQLAKQHHPDHHHGDDPAGRLNAQSKMSEINAAFSDLRRIYQLTDDV